MKNTIKQAGFTLVELAIVLVIIGLIVGGVLVGQDLIKAAEIRAAISQIEKYDTAVNTFRGKYNGLPGDLSSTGFQFSITNIGTDGSTDYGDNDGLIEFNLATGADGTDNGTEVDAESAGFFVHLSQANLIAETLTETDFVASSVTAINTISPNSKLGRGAYVIVRADSSVNYFNLVVPSIASGVATMTDGSQLPVIDAYQFDVELDDSVPNTGKVVAISNLTTVDAGGAAADDICVNTTPTPNAYNTATLARQVDTECMIRVRASF